MISCLENLLMPQSMMITLKTGLNILSILRKIQTTPVKNQAPKKPQFIKFNLSFQNMEPCLQGMKKRKTETTERMMMASQERNGTEKLKVFFTASQKCAA